jgi:hypothetical protein
MQAYVFCNPKYEARLKEVIESEKFNDILGIKYSSK